MQVFVKDTQHTGMHYLQICSLIMQRFFALAMDIVVFFRVHQNTPTKWMMGRIQRI